MKVELGAGARKREGWVAVDLNPRFADVVADALTLPFEDGTVTALRAVDVLEHISYRDTARALTEWARVMQSGAEMYVQVPDADAIMRAYVHNAKSLERTAEGPCTALEGATWRLLGGHEDGKYAGEDDDWRWNAHYAFFSRYSLRDALDKAGFAVTTLTTNGHPNLLCYAKKR